METAWSWFATAYVAVLLAELVGDRSLFAVGALSARYGVRAVLAGVLPAFALKSLVAVMFGRVIATLPSAVIVSASAVTFGISALMVARGRNEAERPRTASTRMSGVVTAFCAIFFTEWADFGQITAATLAARFHAPVAVWSGATLALATKAVLAAMVGAGLRLRVSTRPIRWGATALFLALGALSLVR
jgi:putative Ca2+/H+ antiporter (TMEM165/GDT1 family)